MPDYEPAEEGTAARGASEEECPNPVAGELDALESAVEALLEDYIRLRERVDRTDALRTRLSDAMEHAGEGGLDLDALMKRFEEVAAENRRLRELVREGRERAKRIQSRLILMEDEI